MDFLSRHRQTVILAGVFVLAGILAAVFGDGGEAAQDPDRWLIGPGRRSDVIGASAPRVAPPTSDGVGGRRKGGYEVVPVADGGTVRGVCRLAKPVRLPAIPVSKDRVNCKHAEHASERALYAEAGLTLANCVVWLADIARGKDFAGTLAAKERLALLNQLGCVYMPHVMAIRAKTQLAVKNSDSAEHNIKGLRNRSQVFNLMQPSGGYNADSEGAYLTKTGVYELKCDIHPWMNGYVHVFDHPYFAVTSKDGAFEFADVPPGAYTLVCWHEGMSETPQFAGGEISGYTYGEDVLLPVKVTVEAGGVATHDFTVPAP